MTALKGFEQTQKPLFLPSNVGSLSIFEHALFLQMRKCRKI
uniref:Uncharacterized protein n=1 Tax=Lepeophtheirus salmonis TaxID=72036 RepID=A0A0K2UDA7_LEPSM